jgi:hypothetical protein
MGRLPLIDYSLHPSYQMEPDPERGRQAAEALAPLIEQMTQIEAHRSATFGYRYGPTSDQGEALAHEGALRFRLEASTIGDLVEHAAPAISAVRERMAGLEAQGARPKFAHRMERLTAEAHPLLWADIDAAMQQIGAYALATAHYSARAAKLQNAALLISTSEDQGGGLLYIQDAPGAGLHVDSSGKCILKVVLYLSDVDASCGPFCMTPGSHRWDPGSVERIHRRAFDRSDLKGRSAASRRLFISLPRHMQVKAEFGTDLLPESEDTRALLGAEQATLGEAGTLTLFGSIRGRSTIPQMRA